MTFDGRVAEDEGQEDKAAVEVSKEELMFGDECVCKWEEKSEGRRWRGRVSYSPPEWTLHVLTPAQLSTSLLWPSILSIGSSTCVLMEHHGGIESS